MIPSSSLRRGSHPDFVNMDSEALHPNWCLTPLSTHHLGLLLCLKIHQICFLLQGIHIRTRFYTHNYKSFFWGEKKKLHKNNKTATAFVMQSQLEEPTPQRCSGPWEGLLDGGCPRFLQPQAWAPVRQGLPGVVAAWGPSQQSKLNIQ